MANFVAMSSEAPAALQVPAKAKIALVIVALVHFLLATWFATSTPYRAEGILLGQRDPNRGGPARSLDIGAPDERQHANYIGSLGSTGKFPIFDPKDPNLYETYQSHQPPLYYAIATAVNKVSGDSKPEEASFGTKIRGLNSLLGALNVLLIGLFAIYATKRWEVGTLTSAVAALLPMNVALSGAINNDVLLFCLISVVLVLLARANAQPNLKQAIGIGAIAGLALLTKSTAVLLIPSLFVAAVIQKDSLARKNLVIAAFVGLALASPWLLRNFQLYGDFFALKAFDEAFVGSAQKAMIAAAAGSEVAYWSEWVGWWTARSFIGAFGYMDIWLNDSGRAIAATDKNTLYRLVLAFLVLGGLGNLAGLLNKKAANAETTTGTDESEADEAVSPVVKAFAIVLSVLVVLAFLRFNGKYFQAQARYLYPAIAPIALCLGLGFWRLTRRRLVPALAVVVVVLGGTTIYAGSKLKDEFARRTRPAVTRKEPVAPGVTSFLDSHVLTVA